MSDDFEREVVLKLRTRMRFVTTQRDGKQCIDLVPTESIEVWRKGKRKASAVLVNNAGRAEVLRDLAHWLENNDDPELLAFEAKMHAAKEEG